MSMGERSTNYIIKKEESQNHEDKTTEKDTQGSNQRPKIRECKEIIFYIGMEKVK